ncbi:TetR/AcrR family transcriptional regulator [Actinomadura verrucosospora]|uniref:TetR family transcriptional regulator n=1 Tax=Actinomadura verrucosospora TaxID=46165 RepID=A0A7D3VXY2_ACTVE|nr:TetR/AcrR family transcriptional regulator [Actinomadura verrucosospora]QKG26193.1 TetR family transcriptional regulator [Actinomadura verrucosospora]
MNRGRPRSGHVDEAVADAVRALLAEAGYQALSIDGVAARAGVGKAGIYRRWRSKAEMVFAVVVHGPHPVAPADSGSLRADLSALAEHIIDLLSGPYARLVLPGLTADLSADPALAARFQAGVIDAERALVAEILDRARARGEDAGDDPAFVHALLLGPIYTYLFLAGGEVPPGLADRLASAAVAALGTKESP